MGKELQPLKNRLRGLQRIKEKKEMTEEQAREIDASIKQLEEEIDAMKRSTRTRIHRKQKYNFVMHMEMKKVVRHLNRARREAAANPEDSDAAERVKKWECAQRYIREFPLADHPYVSLFRDPEEEDAREHERALREQIMEKVLSAPVGQTIATRNSASAVTIPRTERVLRPDADSDDLSGSGSEHEGTERAPGSARPPTRSISVLEAMQLAEQQADMLFEGDEEESLGSGDSQDSDFFAQTFERFDASRARPVTHYCDDPSITSRAGRLGVLDIEDERARRRKYERKQQYIQAARNGGSVRGRGGRSGRGGGMSRGQPSGIIRGARRHRYDDDTDIPRGNRPTETKSLWESA